jgi:rhodanese-related sulfurtransferase
MSDPALAAVGPASSSQPGALAWRMARETVLLLALAAALAAGVGAMHPRRPAWHLPYPPQLAPGDARTLPSRILWVDARKRSDYLAAHIRGAVLLNEEQWNTLLPAFLDRWQPGVMVVVYCDDRNCGGSFAVARRLQRELRLDRIYTLKGGWIEWITSGK